MGGCSSHFLMEKRFGCAAGCDFDYCEECQRNAGRESALPATLAIVDMDSNIFYKFPKDEVTSTTVEGFVREYEALQQRQANRGRGTDPQAQASTLVAKT